MIDLEKNVGKVFQQAVQGSAELASSQTRHWDLNRGLAIELQGSLEKITGSQVDALLHGFEIMQVQLACLKNPTFIDSADRATAHF